MKYEDVIVRLKEKGQYEINVSLKYLERTIQDYKNDYKLELNPDFQRGHVWTKEQQIAYVEFLLRGGVTANTIYFNCPYFDDFRSDLYNMDMVCVDGLQRLTALRKFINNEIPVFGYYLKEFEDYEILLRVTGIRININNLKTKKDVLEWYIDFNSGGTVHSQEEIKRVQQMLEDEIKKTDVS